MPQAVAAAAVWVGNAVGAAIVGGSAALGVGLATSLPLAAAAAKGAFLVAEIALYSGLSNLVDDIATQKAAPQGQELNLRIATDVAREMVIGVRPTGGSMVARYSYGKDLTQTHFVYQLADHPIVELSQVWGDGRLVRNTPLTHGVRTEITAYSYSGGPRVWMTFYDGRPGQSHDAWLVTKSATDPDVIAGAVGGWTSAHVGRGIAYVCIEVHRDSDILTSIPEFLFHLKGAKLYDRRKDTTAGGSGSHRHNDPSTWEYSTNNAVACDHYLLGYKVEDDDLAFGVGLSPVEVPYSTFAAAADLCDEDVTTGTGGDVAVMKRYACNAVISAAEPFESVLTSFQNQMAARIVDLGGRIGIIGGEEKAAWLTLDDDDWVSDDSVRFADKLSGDNLVGAVVGSYPDPANLFQPTPYARQETDYLYLPNGGEAATARLDLPFETNSRRAVRLAAAWIKRESIQPRIAGTFATRSLAWKLEPGDWFEMNSARWQFTAAKFEVVDIVKHDDFTVTLTARACDPDFLAFPVDEDPELTIPPTLGPASLLLEAPAFTIAASTIVAGAVVEPCLQVTLTSSEPIARELVVEYGRYDGSSVVSPTNLDEFHAGQTVTKIRKGILPSTIYRLRMKARAGVRESPWSDWSASITTGAVYAVGSAGVADSIIGQGWGATASEAAARATRGKGVAKNGRFEEAFTGTATPPGWANWSFGTGIFTPRTFGDGYCFRLAGGAGVDTGVSQNCPGIQPSTDYVMAAEVRRDGGTFYGAGMLCEFYTPAFAFLGSAQIHFATAATTSGLVNPAPDGIQRYEKLVTTPAGTGVVAIYAMAHWHLHGSVASANSIEWYECDFIPLTMVKQLRADITGSNTAAAIAGQGALATNNTVTTGLVAANAITSSAVTTGGVGGASVAITTTGGPVVLMCSLQSVLNSDYGGSDYAEHIPYVTRSGGPTLYPATIPANRTQGGYSYANWAATVVDYPPAGTHTYNLSASYNHYNGTYSYIGNATLVALELKR